MNYDFDRKGHWESVYGNKVPAEVSWYQSEPKISLELIVSLGMGYTAKIIDVGGGASVLVYREMANDIYVRLEK